MKTGYEDKIKMAFEMQCSDISASETLKQKIDEEICRQGKIVPMPRSAEQRRRAEEDILSGGMEDNTMKKTTKNHTRFSTKKFVVGVAAACLLISGSAFAGKTAGYISGFSVDTYAYEELDKAEEKLGFTVDLPENFSNGYGFEEMKVGEVHAADENWDTLYTFPELSADYIRDGVSDISLYVHEKLEESELTKEADMTDQCGEIAIRYDLYTYKFVPAGYELTEEDQANLERDDYEISEGADEIEYRQVSHVTWVKNGVFYDLLGSDTALSGEEMIEMAKEIIAAN